MQRLAVSNLGGMGRSAFYYFCKKAKNAIKRNETKVK
jgi:hypothetical protein